MTQYLLQIHIGPMQEFIAAARRTRDLWFGSWLMSELSKAVARKVAELAGEESLIFPAASLAELAPGTELSVTNKIVAQVEDPKIVAGEAEEAVRRRLGELAEIALSEARGRLETRETAEKQIRDLPEFYWAAVPIEGEEGYANARKLADNLLAARKSCRNFEQPDWGSSRPKSSLDGSRESVIPEELSGNTQRMFQHFRAKAGEQLSGVDLLKRLGKRQEGEQPERFPSTSHMAALPLGARLAEKAGDAEVLKKWRDYIGMLPSEVLNQEKVYHNLNLPILDDLDGSLLFESRLLDYVDRTDPDFDSLKKKLADFLKAAEIEAGDLIPYYALLHGDGDSMGKAISQLKKAKDHQDFSKKLAKFAVKARKIIRKNKGAVVYAGGDDVMALLPLHTAIPTAAKLTRTFRKHMGGLTFSAGIAIFHHLEPLEDALALARKAEKEAKDLDEAKNALAIILSKRSGEPRTVLGRWGEINKRLVDFAGYYQQEHLPHGLAHQLRDMVLHLGGNAAVRRDSSLQEVIAKEAERIIKRKEGSDEAADRVVAAVSQLDYCKTSIETLSGELVIAALIADAQTLAQGERT